MTATRVDKYYAKKYVPLVLWWDDVAEIFNLLKARAETIELSTEDYKFATLESAKEILGSKPQYSFKISSTSPYMSLEDSRLHISPGEKSAQLFLELDEILKSKQRWPKWMYSQGLIAIVLFFSAAQFSTTDQYVRMALLAVQTPLAIIYLRGLFVGMKREMVVMMQRRDESPSFMRRNRDQLMMMLISAVVGGLLTFAATQLKDKYFPAATTAPK